MRCDAASIHWQQAQAQQNFIHFCNDWLKHELIKWKTWHFLSIFRSERERSRLFFLPLQHAGTADAMEFRARAPSVYFPWILKIAMAKKKTTESTEMRRKSSAKLVVIDGINHDVYNSIWCAGASKTKSNLISCRFSFAAIHQQVAVGIQNSCMLRSTIHPTHMRCMKLNKSD